MADLGTAARLSLIAKRVFAIVNLLLPLHKPLWVHFKLLVVLVLLLLQHTHILWSVCSGRKMRLVLLIRLSSSVVANAS